MWVISFEPGEPGMAILSSFTIVQYIGVYHSDRRPDLKGEDFIKAIDDFHEKYCIGKGGFGRVYKAELLSGQVVTVKRLNFGD
ncbi:unnamed protein product [Prunus armeniaca]